MHAAGQKVFDERDQKRSGIYIYERTARTLDGVYEKKFRANKKAWEFYGAQPPGYRRTSTGWVLNAKREETRLRRLGQLIEVSAKGRRLDMLTPLKKG
jgi:uncharacterized protein YdeI (YjbR/CyaY-like superfamily)